MEVMLPVLADVRVDDRRAVLQIHVCSALPRLPVPLNVVPLRCNSNHDRTPSCGDHLHPQDILCFEGLGVHEGGGMFIIFALRLPVLNLTMLITLPASRVKAAKSRAGHRQESCSSDFVHRLFTGPANLSSRWRALVLGLFHRPDGLAVRTGRLRTGSRSARMKRIMPSSSTPSPSKQRMS